MYWGLVRVGDGLLTRRELLSYFFFGAGVLLLCPFVPPHAESLTPRAGKTPHLSHLWVHCRHSTALRPRKPHRHRTSPCHALQPRTTISICPLTNPNLSPPRVDHGSSSHPNHVSLPKGAAHLPRTLPAKPHPRPRLFPPVTVSLREKYLSALSPGSRATRRHT